MKNPLNDKHRFEIKVHVCSVVYSFLENFDYFES